MPFFEYSDIIPDFHAFEESLQKPAPRNIRVNRLKIEPKPLVRLLKAQGVRLERSTDRDDTLYTAPPHPSPGNLLAYYLGYLHPQALTSCLASLALSPPKEAYVLDLCAAPGGKTAHLAQLMGNSGLIVANELNPRRHVPLGHTLDRLGVLNALVTAYQAQQFPLKARFDRVLADVPCSAEGRFRQTRRDAPYQVRKARTKLPDLQKKILLRGFDLLKPLGELLYATCTYDPEENESIVNFLLNNRDADLLPLDVDQHSEPGITQWKDQSYDPRVRMAARFYPHRIDSVGFFMARICRRR